jgi:antitoxin (DNA-binding transcriptional repressor) of toxin-antitoxin stability system
MKVITVAEAEGRLPEIIYAVTQGEYVVLKDGDREVALTARLPGGVEVDEENAELEAELLKSADGPFRPYSPENLDEIARQVLAKRWKE